MTTHPHEQSRPWYREFWAWFALAVVGLGVASGTIVVVISLGSAPQIVTGDHQPLGKALVDTRERARAAKALGLVGQLSVNGELAELRLEAHRPADLPDELLLRFEHPFDASLDISALAVRTQDDHWQAVLDTVSPPVRARVILTDLTRSWALAGRFSDAVTGTIELESAQL